nr:hypothetical protein [Clostridium botulinum]
MFNRLFNKIYFKRKNGEIKRGKSKLRRMKVDSILRILQKDCSNKNVKYDVIEKNWDSILVLLEGKMIKHYLSITEQEWFFMNTMKSF